MLLLMNIHLYANEFSHVGILMTSALVVGYINLCVWYICQHAQLCVFGVGVCVCVQHTYMYITHLCIHSSMGGMFLHVCMLYVGT